MNKRILIYVLIAFLLLTGSAWKLGILDMLAGSVFGTGSNSTSGSGKSDTAEATADSPVTITIGHYFGDTDMDETARYVQIILKQIQEEHPEINIEQIICDNETYKDRLKIMAATNDMPDIMFGYGGGMVKVLAEKGKLLELDDYLNDFTKSHMIAETQSSFIVDGSRYGICYTDWIGLLYCNTELFEKAGLEIPTTYEELLEDCKVFNEMGVTPIACGMLNQWMGQQWINNFTIQLGGTGYYEQIANGNVSFDNDTLAQAAQLTADLVEAQAFGETVCNMTSSEAEELFLSGNAAMIYDGDWMTSNAEESLGDDVAVIEMPAVCEDNHETDYHGGAVNGWMVSADTQYPEYCVMIVEELAYQLALYQPTRATFTLESEDSTQQAEGQAKYEVEKYGRQLTTLERSVMSIKEKKTNGGLAYDTLLSPSEADIWLDMCWELFQGNMTGREFTETLQSKTDEIGGR